MRKKDLRKLAVLNTIVYLVMIAINALANILPINGVTTGQVSDSIDTLFAPIGLTFSIWALIYILLGLFIIYQFRALASNRSIYFIEEIGSLFIVNALANAAWIVAWHYGQILISLVIMLVILLTLVAISIALSNLPGNDRTERLYVGVAFSFYLGWISVATIANAAALLTSRGWAGFGISPHIWTSVMIVIAIALALAALGIKRDVAYALAIDWALLGIFLKRYAAGGLEYPAIIWTSVAGIVCISIASIFTLIGQSKRERRVWY